MGASQYDQDAPLSSSAMVHPVLSWVPTSDLGVRRPWESANSLLTGSLSCDSSQLRSGFSTHVGTCSGVCPKRILVTGGAGFIGSHLIGRLLDQGHDVICLDSYISGNKANIVKYRNHLNFELINHDITKEFRIEVDKIYHLACPASPVQYQCNAIKTLKTNVLGTLNMLGLAKRTNARLLLASTSEVYGDPDVHPQHEEYNGNVNPVGRRSCYDEGKRAAEALCMDYHRQHNVDIRIARIFNTYGPTMNFDDGRVVSNFIVQALRGECLTIYGDGTQTRSFCYVTDLVEGLIRLMENGKTVGPINLGNPAEYTVLELAHMVKELADPELPIHHRPLPKDDPKKRQPDITKARHFLNWEPRVGLRQGLKITIQDFAIRAVQAPYKLVCAHQEEAKSTHSEDHQEKEDAPVPTGGRDNNLPLHREADNNFSEIGASTTNLPKWLVQDKDFPFWVKEYLNITTTGP